MSKTDSHIWVKASERLPDKAGRENQVIVKFGEAVYYGFKNFNKEKPQMYIETDIRAFLTLNCEWLNESPKEDQQPSQPIKSAEEMFEERSKEHFMKSGGLGASVAGLDRIPFVIHPAIYKIMEDYHAQFKDQQPSGDVEKAAKEYALKWVLTEEKDDWWDKKEKKNKRLEIEEHFENGAKWANTQPIKEDTPADETKK